MTDDELIAITFKAVWPSMDEESALYRESRTEAGRRHYLRIGRAVEAAVTSEMQRRYDVLVKALKAIAIADNTIEDTWVQRFAADALREAGEIT